MGLFACFFVFFGSLAVTHLIILGPALQYAYHYIILWLPYDFLYLYSVLWSTEHTCQYPVQW